MKIAALTVAAIMAFGPHATRAYASSPVLEASYTNGISNGWVKVERWRDPDGAFVQETFPPDGRGNQTGQRATFFSSSQPHSRNFLMYYAPGWDSNSNPVPVLLVHGATQNADQAWANPSSSPGTCGKFSCPSTGLMQELSAEGYRVFAINFPHGNGDGYFWSEQIADAIDVIKNATGATQVDVIAWSKGVFNSRMYVSSLKKSWGTAYRGDVRRMILLGGPNGGFDWSFRHGTYGSVSVFPECGGVVNGPAVHEWMLCFGAWWYRPQWAYDSNYFPGARQMLKRWDSVYSPAVTEFDWWSTYYGGWGYTSYARGINAYLGGSLVDSLQTAGIPASIRTHLLCGDQNDIPFLHNEHTGPSDGMIFLSSCLDATGIGTSGGAETVASNHLELGWQSTSTSKILSWLSAP